MISSLLITFRETFEVSLIVGIIYSYLFQTGQTRFNKIVNFGIVAGITASILGAIIFTLVAGGFKGNAEKIFEGLTMIIGSILLTMMILWMMNQKNISQSIKKQIDVEIKKTHQIGLFTLVFVSVLREGIETVIFLNAARFATQSNMLLGSITGILIAVLLGYFIFSGTRKVNIKFFFNFSSILLILFAAGLVAHGVHELQEASLLPVFVEQLWDINPPLNTDGSYPVFHEKGLIGSILKGLFGYNGNPSILEFLSWLFYLILIAIIWVKRK